MNAFYMCSLGVVKVFFSFLYEFKLSNLLKCYLPVFDSVFSCLLDSFSGLYRRRKEIAASWKLCSSRCYRLLFPRLSYDSLTLGAHLGAHFFWA